MIVFTRDKHRLQKHFRKDPVLFAYHLGDLEGFHFENCQWAAIYGDSRYIQDVILVYSTQQVATVLIFGLTDLMVDALTEILDLLPRRFFCHYNNEKYIDLLSNKYNVQFRGPHQKMKLQTPPIPNQNSPSTGVEYLQTSDSEALKALYSEALPDGFFDSRMLNTGKCVGIREGSRIIAAAGVHVYSPEQQTAVIGAVAVHADRRNRGLCAPLCGKLASELHSEGLLVTLNVTADNLPAIKCYERLGFVKTHDYWEAILESK